MKLPQMDLDATLEFIRSLEEEYHDKQISVADICKVLTINSPQNHRYSRMVSTAKEFKLLEKINKNGMKISKLAKEIIYPTDEKQLNNLKYQAIRNSSAYAKLIDKFDNEGYPTINVLSNILINEYGVSSDKSKNVANIFLKSIDQIGVVSETSNNDDISDSDEKESNLMGNNEPDSGQMDLFNNEMVSSASENNAKIINRVKEEPMTDENIKTNKDYYSIRIPLSGSEIKLDIPSELIGQKEQLITVKRIIDKNIESIFLD